MTIPSRSSFPTKRRLGSIPATKRRVPHISLVFREMWDTTAVDRQPVGSTDKNIEKKSC
jgi:hypothetical protein